MFRLPLDAFPDTTPVVIQIHTVAPSLSPEEIEQQITLPIEQALGGLRGLDEVRSFSKFGFSIVTVTFTDGLPACLYFFDLPSVCRAPSSRIIAAYDGGHYQ